MRGFNSLLAIALLGGGAVAGCNAVKPDNDCDRLQDYSCQCFPDCQMDDVDIFNSADDARCNARLANRFNYWKICQGTCRENCEYGWGSCAFSHYRRIGLTPEQPCDRDGAADAGAD